MSLNASSALRRDLADAKRPERPRQKTCPPASDERLKALTAELIQAFARVGRRRF
jgi:hypothetical protein